MLRRLTRQRSPWHAILIIRFLIRSLIPLLIFRAVHERLPVIFAIRVPHAIAPCVREVRINSGQTIQHQRTRQQIPTVRIAFLEVGRPPHRVRPWFYITECKTDVRKRKETPRILGVSEINAAFSSDYRSGETGIRTLGTLAGTPVFRARSTPEE